MSDIQLTDKQVRWSNLKYSHAEEMLADLQKQIEMWNATGPVMITAVKTSPRTIEFQQQVSSLPPIERWSLLLGDIVHNLRASLDTLAWELATLDLGRPPVKPKKIYFPTAADEHDWDTRWKPDLSDIPSALVERMRKLQGFANPSSPENPLLELHALDIGDKHKGLLRPTIAFDTAHYSAQVRPPFGQQTFSGHLTPFTPSEVLIRQGSPIGGFATDMDFLLPAQEPQPATIIPMIALNGKKLRVTDFTSLIAHWVRYALDTVRYDTEQAAQRLIDAGLATTIEEGPPRRIEMVTPL
jgi:hypothetical protein